MSLQPCQEWKKEFKCHKSQYMCIWTYKIKYFDFSNYFCHFETAEVMKIQENWKILNFNKKNE